jgi:hypothetical protein
MAYSQSKKTTGIEKKLQVIRTQLYGKDNGITTYSIKTENTKTKSTLKESSAVATFNVDYLKKDLLKIVLLTILAMGAQMFIYFSQTHKLIGQLF